MIAIRILRVITLALLAVALGIGVMRWQYSRETIDDFGPLGEFTFIASTGGKVTQDDFAGKVTVYSCFFTCCTTSCPILTAKMGELQTELADLPDVRLVSLTVDPEHDTPEKLRSHAENFSADPKRWLFLTGDRAEVESFVIKQLKQGLEQNKSKDAPAGEKFLHSERLTVVDRAGRIRGWFAGTNADEMDKLKQLVRKLHE